MTPTENQCGFEYSIKKGYRIEDFNESNKWITDSEENSVYCCRDEWGGFNRCIWHAETEDKSVQALESARTDAPERLDGAYLKGIELADDIPFSGCGLSQANLSNVDLRNADLDSAILIGTDVSESILWEADLSDAILWNTDLTKTDLWKADLRGAFLDSTVFVGSDLRECKFQNVRAYQAIFSNVRVNKNTKFGRVCLYEKRPDIQIEYEDTNRFDAAVWFYRQLEMIYENNAIFEQARHYHIRKQEMQRKYYRWQFWRDLGNRSPWMALKSAQRYTVSSLNFGLTEHGENLQRLVSWAVITILVSGFLYPFVGGIEDTGTRYCLVGETCQNTNLIPNIAEGLYFSTITFTTIGYANVAPIGTGSRILVGFESLAGAVMVALFVYVLGRRATR